MKKFIAFFIIASIAGVGYVDYSVTSDFSVQAGLLL